MITTFSQLMQNYSPKACQMPEAGCVPNGWPDPLAGGWTLALRQKHDAAIARANRCRHCGRTIAGRTLLATVASVK